MDAAGCFVIGCILLCGSDAAPVGNTTVATTSTTTTTNSTDKGADDDSKHYYNHDGNNNYDNHYDHYGHHYGNHYGNHYGDYGHNNYDHHGEDMFGHVKTNLTKDPSHDHIMHEYLNYGFSQHGHDNKTEGILGKISKYIRNDAVTTLTSKSVTLLCLTVGMVSQAL